MVVHDLLRELSCNASCPHLAFNSVLEPPASCHPRFLLRLFSIGHFKYFELCEPVVQLFLDCIPDVVAATRSLTFARVFVQIVDFGSTMFAASNVGQTARLLRKDPSHIALFALAPHVFSCIAHHLCMSLSRFRYPPLKFLIIWVVALCEFARRIVFDGMESAKMTSNNSMFGCTKKKILRQRYTCQQML